MPTTLHPTTSALRRAAFAGALACSLAVAATACGGGDGDDTASTEPTTIATATTQPTAATVGAPVTLPPTTAAPSTAPPTTAAPTTTPATTAAPAPPTTAAPTGPSIDDIRTAMLTLEQLGSRFTQTPYDAVTPLGGNLCGERAGTVRVAETRTFSGTNEAGQAINLIQSLANFATVDDAVAAFDAWRGGFERCPTGPVQLDRPATYTVKRVEAADSGLPLCTELIITAREFTADGDAFASGYEAGAVVRCGRNVMMFANVAESAPAAADGAIFQLFSTYLVTRMTEIAGSADG